MRHNHDEDPIYLFDPKFEKHAPSLQTDYEVPIYFQEDFLAAFGDTRPYYRWFVIGPTRSGSPFHIDPDCTSAWNALLVSIGWKNLKPCSSYDVGWSEKVVDVPTWLRPPWC